MQRLRIPFGVLAFVTGFFLCCLRFGPQILDSGNIRWLIGDLQIHYLGLLFFRFDTWGVPLGKFSTVLPPIGSSVGLTDSIPIIGFIVKSFSSALPRHFNYFGLWLALCYSLQMMFGYLILKEFIKSRPWAFLLSIFFALSPALTAWRFVHPALCAHFLFLWCFWLLIKARQEQYLVFPKYHFFAIFFLASTIHPYLVAITFFMYGISVWNFSMTQADSKKEFLWSITRTTWPVFLMIGFNFWLCGYFVSEGVGDWGFGFYNLNLVSFINPLRYSYFLSALPQGEGQSEGYSYLGLGLLVLVPSFLKFAKGYELKKDLKVTALFLIASFVFAIGPNITIGAFKLISFSKLYYLLGPIPGAFRATGRFIWPVNYALITAILVFNWKYLPEKYKRPVFVLAIALQFVDLSPLFFKRTDSLPWRPLEAKNDYFEYEKIVFPGSFSRLVYLPQNHIDLTPDCSTGGSIDRDQLRSIYMYALENKITVQWIYGAARSPSTFISQHCATLMGEISEGAWRDRTLYVLSDETLAKVRIPSLVSCNRMIDLNWCHLSP